MLKPLLLLSSAALFAFGAATVPALMAQESSAKNAKAGTENLAKAKKIYEVDCALCHGSNGNGKTDLAKDMSLTLNDFADPKTLSSKSDQELFDLIRKGKDKMPGEDENRAKNDDVKALIQYLRNFPKNQPAAAPAPEAPAAPAAPTAQAPSSR